MQFLKKISAIFLLSALIGANISFAASSSNYVIQNGQSGPVGLTGSSSNFNSNSSGTSGISSTSTNFGVQGGGSFSSPAAAPAPTPTPAPASSGGGGGGLVLVDTSKPKLLDLQIINILNNKATLQFTFNERAAYKLRYGKNTTLNNITNFGTNFTTDYRITLENLSPNTKYSFELSARDLAGNESAFPVTSFNTQPVISSIENVSNLKAIVENGKISLLWNNPAIPDLDHIRVLRRTDSFSQDINDGTVVFSGKNDFLTDATITKTGTYYYSVFVFNQADEHSSGSIISVYIDLSKQPAKKPEEKKKIEKPIEQIEQIEKIEEEVKQTIKEIEKEPMQDRSKEQIAEVLKKLNQLLGKANEIRRQLELGLEHLEQKEIDNLEKDLRNMADKVSRLRQNLQDGVKKLLNATLEQKQNAEESLQKELKNILNSIDDLNRNINGKLENLQNNIRNSIRIGLELSEKLAKALEKEKDKLKIIPAQKPELPKGSEQIYNSFNLNDEVIRFYTLAKQQQINEKIYSEGDLTDEAIRLYLLAKQQKEEKEETVPETVAMVSPLSIKAREQGADWHIFANQQALLSISADVLKKPVKTVIATMQTEAYVLEFNPANNAYEASVRAPGEKGQYQVIVQIIYQDNTFEEINKSVLVDPYGYVYVRTLQNLFHEERVVGATVVLFTKNKAGAWVTWPAKLYGQLNPQITDINGKFIFFAPPGEYYLLVYKEGFPFYKSTVFKMDGQIININVLLNRASLTIWILGFISAIIITVTVTEKLIRKK